MKIELTARELRYIYDAMQTEYSELKKQTKNLITVLGPEKCKTDSVLRYAVLKQQDLYCIIDKIWYEYKLVLLGIE